MKIRTKLLRTFLPLVIIPACIIGYIAINHGQFLSDRISKITFEEERLHQSYEEIIGRIIEISEHKLTADYQYISQHLLGNVATSYEYLKKILETVAQSNLLESYICGPVNGREIMIDQINTLFNNVIKNYLLSEISVLTTDGRELRQTMEIVHPDGDPDFDGEQLTNINQNESQSEWFKLLKAEKGKFISNFVHFEKHFDIKRPEPVLSFACPIRYKDNHYSAKYGKTLAYLKFTIPVAELCKTIIVDTFDTEKQVLVTDSENRIVVHGDPSMRGRFFETNAPELKDHIIFRQPFLSDLLQIYILVSMSEIQKISSVAKSLSSELDEHNMEIGKLSEESNKNITQLVKITGWLTFITLFIAITLVVGMTKKISAPISHLYETAKQIAAGDLKVKPDPLIQASQDEIGLLARELDIMRLNLKDSIEKLDGKVKEKTEQLLCANKLLTQEITERKKAEKALRESEQRFRYITEFSPFPISIINNSGQYIYLNKKFIKVFGYTLEDIPSGKEWLSLAFPDPKYRQQIVSAWKSDYRNLKKGMSKPRLFKVRCQDAKIRDIIFRLIAIDDEKQFIIHQDITDFKRAEKKLRASEEKYRELINNSLDGVISVDSKGEIILWNPAAEKIFGYTNKEIQGQSIMQIIPKRYRQAAEKGFTPFRKTGLGPIIGKILAVEGLRKDGEEISVEISISSRKAEGDYIAMAIIRDITERRRAEEDLRIKESVIDSSMNGIAIADLERMVTYVNNSFLKMLGYKNEKEVLGKSIKDFWQAPGNGYCKTEDYDDTEAWSGEKTARKKDGSLLSIQISTNIVTDKSGKPICWNAFFIDLTERNYLERAILEISENEQRRIGRDLHDGLGQHLTGTAFKSKALEQKLTAKKLPEASDSAEIAKFINQAISQIRNVASLLNPVKLNEDGLMIALKKFASNVSEIFEIFCTFYCIKPVLIHDNIMATHLYRIAQEAVNNAIKHAKTNHIAISLAKANSYITMTIKDNGLGFPKAINKDRGIGLNLMSYRARVIGAALDIQSNPDGGTIVVCSLEEK